MKGETVVVTYRDCWGYWGGLTSPEPPAVSLESPPPASASPPCWQQRLWTEEQGMCVRMCVGRRWAAAPSTAQTQVGSCSEAHVGSLLQPGTGAGSCRGKPLRNPCLPQGGLWSYSICSCPCREAAAPPALAAPLAIRAPEHPWRAAGRAGRPGKGKELRTKKGVVGQAGVGNIPEHAPGARSASLTLMGSAVRWCCRPARKRCRGKGCCSDSKVGSGGGSTAGRGPTCRSMGRG